MGSYIRSARCIIYLGGAFANTSGGNGGGLAPLVEVIRTARHGLHFSGASDDASRPVDQQSRESSLQSISLSCRGSSGSR